MPQILVIIPARIGSKGIPRKNLQMVAGHPLISWVIRTARGVKCVDRVVVTTDSQEISEVAIKYGAEVPFIRPKELAQDTTPGIAPAIHTVEWLYEYEAYRPDYILYIQPTSPLVSAEDIEGAVMLAKQKEANAVLSVSQVDKHPNIMKILDEDGRIRHYAYDPNACRRQDYSELYALNGAIWLIRKDVLLKKRDWYTERTYAYVMPKERSLDIDTPWDLHVADLILKSNDVTNSTGGEL